MRNLYPVAAMRDTFVKTGCLLTIDGHQNAINVEGLPNYSLPDVNATCLVINLDSSDEGSVGDSGLSDFEGSSDDEDLWDKDDSKIGDHEEVFIVFNEGLILWNSPLAAEDSSWHWSRGIGCRCTDQRNVL
uniref:Uncharacterized protein n=1 Tax=Spongospora subterranea TaxID=70186 RepID=A0A0H5QTV4_9EUKA|eukprot:CRZ05438.1 hypothetical protein [Spongospora subterranea]